MELVGLLLGVAGIVISIAIAYWEHRKAVAAETHLNDLVANLPTTLLASVNEALGRYAQHQSFGPSLDGSTAAPANPITRTSYGDVNSDGQQELLVELPVGAYSSALLVFGMKDWEFQKLGELYSTTLGGFSVGDFDRDGRVEIRTDEIARRPNLPYVFGLRDEVTYRFEDGDFKEVSRKEMWTEDDLLRVKNMIPSDAEQHT